jgi:hypothetical protein
MQEGIITGSALLVSGSSFESQTFSPPVKPMSLIVALQTSENKIVLAADSLCMTTSNGLGEPEQYTYRCDKLNRVAGTDWLIAYAGVSLDYLRRKINAEIASKARTPFNPNIEIGGPEYLAALSQELRSTPNGDKIFCPTILAGFGTDENPVVFGASLPRPGYSVAPSIYPLGAQEACAFWIMRSLGACCLTVESVKSLACFTIWQMAKMDARIGDVSSGYPISICVMSPREPIEIEHLDTVPEWMENWEEKMQNCFIGTVNEGNSPAT